MNVQSLGPNPVKAWLFRALCLKQIRCRHRGDDSYKVLTKLAEKHARRVAAYVTPEMLKPNLDHNQINETILEIAYTSQSPDAASARNCDNQSFAVGHKRCSRCVQVKDDVHAVRIG